MITSGENMHIIIWLDMWCKYGNGIVWYSGSGYQDIHDP